MSGGREPSISPEQARQALARIKGGMTVKQAAESIGVTNYRTLISRFKRDPELAGEYHQATEKRAGTGEKWTAERTAEAVRLAEEGLGSDQVAARMGLVSSALPKARKNNPELDRRLREVWGAPVPRAPDGEGARMRYRDLQGANHQLTESSAAYLAAVADHGPLVTRRGLDKSRSVRLLQERGLIRVAWSGTDRTGEWRIEALTDLGRAVYAAWREKQESESDG